MENKPTSATMVGLIIGLILAVFSLILYFAGLFLEDWVVYPFYSIMILGIIWGVYNHGKETQNTAKFGELFLFGFKVAATMACVLLVYNLISGYVFPDIKEQLMIKSSQEIDKLPQGEQAEKKAGMEMFAKNYTLLVTMGTIFGCLFIGAIASLIGAAITKKKPKDINFDNA